MSAPLDNTPSSNYIPNPFKLKSSTLHALPLTDLWRKPPSTDVSNAKSYTIAVPIDKFKRARVTVNAPWKRLYDQGGLVIFLSGQPRPWIKTGIEFYHSQPNFSTVACQTTASDWSLVPLTSGTVTMEIEREGVSLRVYHLDPEGNRIAAREVTWVFESLEGGLDVGIYAARPTQEPDEEGEGEALQVLFENLEIEMTDT